MLSRVYTKSGTIRNHCGAEPPRNIEPAGLVESTVDAQRRVYRLKPGPLQELDAWLAQFRRFWSAHLDALERHLDRMDHDRMDQKTPTKRKTEKTTRPKPRK